MLDGYQLEAMAVRTCRRCANDGRYGPITSDGAIEHNDELICRDCARRRELERELSYKSEFTGAAEERLEELLYESGDLDRIVNLLQGGLDPDLTKYDEVSANVDDISPVRTEDLDLHPDLCTSAGPLRGAAPGPEPVRAERSPRWYRPARRERDRDREDPRRRASRNRPGTERGREAPL